jgi:hypothetical protein
MSTGRKHVLGNPRLRWWIANQLNRLPGQCWAGLVTWALDWKTCERRGPWSPQGPLCRRGAAECGVCYCGKIRAGDAPADVQPERAA